LAADGKQQAAYHVANGRKIFEDKGIKLQKATTDELGERFAKLAGDSITHLPQVRGQLQTAVSEAYLSMVSQKGQSLDDFNKKVYDEAFSSVVGETAKINGKRVVVPTGMDEGQFKDFFKNIGGETVKSAGGVRGFKTPEAAAGYIRSYGKLYEMGNGRYRVAADGRFLQTDDGKDFVLSIGAHY
jgi:hypothetical protein